MSPDSASGNPRCMARKSSMRSRDSRAAPALLQKLAGKQGPAATKNYKKAPAGRDASPIGAFALFSDRTRAHALPEPKLSAVGHVKAGKLLLKVSYLGKVEHGDVPIFRVLGGIILVIVFSSIESFK